MKRASKGYTRENIPLFSAIIVQGPVVQGEGSTHLVESYHTPTSAPSTSQLQFPTFSRKKTRPGSGNIDKNPTMPQRFTSPKSYTLEVMMRSIPQQECGFLYNIVKECRELGDRIEAGQRNIWCVLYWCFPTEGEKVKGKQFSTSQARRRARLLSVDYEDIIWRIFKQRGGTIAALIKDHDISFAELRCLKEGEPKEKEEEWQEDCRVMKQLALLMLKNGKTYKLEFERVMKSLGKGYNRGKRKDHIKLNKQECLQGISTREESEVAESSTEASNLKFSKMGTEEEIDQKALGSTGRSLELEIILSLVKENFKSIKPTDDKEIEIWVELKRLFEPDTHDLTWRLYDSCGVHHVSIEKGIDIYMLVEKEYPLSRGTLTSMLVAKLLVDQDNDMSKELLRKIFMQVSRVGRTMTCKNCWEKGHNKASCKKDPQPKPEVEKKPLGRKKQVFLGQCASRGGGRSGRGDGNDGSGSSGGVNDGSGSGVNDCSRSGVNDGSGSGGRGGGRAGGRGKRGGGRAGRGSGRGSRGGVFPSSSSTSILTDEEEYQLELDEQAFRECMEEQAITQAKIDAEQEKMDKEKREEQE
ncbi:hypothetical protein Tco_0386360 [Tanacetum coccineum]